MIIPAAVFDAYSLSPDSCIVEPIGTGLINHTWMIETPGHKLILQRINDKVFQQPDAIETNIEIVSSYLQHHHPDYLFIAPVVNRFQKTIYADESGYWRMFPYMEGSHTVDVLKDPSLAFKAAQQFGRFVKLLKGVDPDQLIITIPDFHNLSYRYQQFTDSLANGNRQRIDLAASEIDFLNQCYFLVELFQTSVKEGNWRKRIMHHDTKISNVLFDQQNHAIAVIDLDTIMPGYFFSDVGDMMRTYLSPVSEEETNLDFIEARDEYFKAILQGFGSEMGEELTMNEKAAFVQSGELMIYMQALRFLTDFLNNDSYYGARYELHNYNRAKNQVTLLKQVLEKETIWNEWVKAFFQL